VPPGGPSTYDVDSFRVAMSVQYFVWGLGVSQILRYRRRVRSELKANDPAAYDALRAGERLDP
ncbi:MAG: MFS transporter, partial [Pedococcus sp.]